jgi:hypothetical protein
LRFGNALAGKSNRGLAQQRHCRNRRLVDEGCLADHFGLSRNRSRREGSSWGLGYLRCGNHLGLG